MLDNIVCLRGLMPWKPVDVTEREVRDAVRAFSKRCRFLIDENLHVETAPFLRGEGWNVKTVTEAGLRGRSDEDVLALAYREDRVLLTHDGDYLDDRRFPMHRNPGVVVLPGAEGDHDLLVRALMDLAMLLAPHREILRNSKVVLRADRTLAITYRRFGTGRVETDVYRIYRGRVQVLEPTER